MWHMDNSFDGGGGGDGRWCVLWQWSWAEERIAKSRAVASRIVRYFAPAESNTNNRQKMSKIFSPLAYSHTTVMDQLSFFRNSLNFDTELLYSIQCSTIMNQRSEYGRHIIFQEPENAYNSVIIDCIAFKINSSQK